jgi:vacuolar-type H+-ATPase subunit H
MHGARIQSPRDLLVGMHITIESPRTGIVAKAICVRTNESVLGSEVRYVSVQLEKPGNIWGIENPPDDWAILENSGTVQPGKARLPAASGIPVQQIAALEQQATQIVDAAAQRLRGLVEEMLGQAFDEFQQRLDSALAAADSRMDEHSSQSLAQLEMNIKKFQEDLNEDLDLQAAQTVATTEQALRAQIPTILASILTPGLQPTPVTKLDLKPEH